MLCKDFVVVVSVLVCCVAVFRKDPLAVTHIPNRISYTGSDHWTDRTKNQIFTMPQVLCLML